MRSRGASAAKRTVSSAGTPRLRRGCERERPRVGVQLLPRHCGQARSRGVKTTDAARPPNWTLVGSRRTSSLAFSPGSQMLNQYLQLLRCAYPLSYSLLSAYQKKNTETDCLCPSSAVQNDPLSKGSRGALLAPVQAGAAQALPSSLISAAQLLVSLVVTLRMKPVAGGCSHARTRTALSS